MNGSAHNTAGTEELRQQRQRARRGAILLGILAACMYFGFILATGLRN